MSGKFLGRIFGRFFHLRYFSDFDIYDINVHVICRTSQVVGNFLVQSLHRMNVIIEPFLRYLFDNAYCGHFESVLLPGLDFIIVICPLGYNRKFMKRTGERKKKKNE